MLSSTKTETGVRDKTGSGEKARRTFLTAQWLNLAMINYQIDPELLLPLVPLGTELDSWNGRTFVSLVGFRFMRTRVVGFRIPFHSNFEEINLRFYVRRKGPEGWRRGVVFVREIVPRIAISTAARWLYGEKYVALPMRHEIIESTGRQETSVSYMFKNRGKWNGLGVSVAGPACAAEPDSVEEFITEHYWGYTRLKGLKRGGSLEYRVEHPRWLVWQAVNSSVEIDAGSIYGEAFADCLSRKPASAFLAEGSDVAVRMGVRI
ncbi:MAG TPA: DUF2071 domain-containing protein [Blastocatellia bacterium]|nr:DUF2071 domain-containing protein [Blastocatellia bacterium]